MHILLVANADSIWVQKYIEKVLIPLGARVTVLSQSHTAFCEFYEKNDICIVTTHPDILGHLANTASINQSLMQRCMAAVKPIIPQKIKQFIRKTLTTHSSTTFMQKISPPDIIHMHYIPPDMQDIFSPLLRHFTSKVVLTYWGSDLLRLTKARCNEQLLQRSSAVTFMTTNLCKHFHNVYGSDFNNKLQIIDFGVSVYDALDLLKQAPEAQVESRRRFQIPEGKICIMLGYNASPGQQHAEMIDSIERLPQGIKEKCHVLLQYSYNYTTDKKYYKSISDKLHTASFSWGIIDDFLDDNQSAYLRNAVDVFVHAQTTDALSASMLEYLYAGAIVLNGSWLKYHELESRGIAYLQFDNFLHLSQLLESIVKAPVRFKKTAQANQGALYALNSWAAVQSHWVGLYEQCLEGLSHAQV